MLAPHQRVAFVLPALVYGPRFASDLGGFRSPTVLDKPFKDVCKHLALDKGEAS